MVATMEPEPQDVPKRVMSRPRNSQPEFGELVDELVRLGIRHLVG
jgi:hypothetical protein